MLTAPSTQSFLDQHTVSNEEALQRLVKSGCRIGSGFATSEPHTFYAGLWDHVRRADVVDLVLRQALHMAAHPLCVGDALQAPGMFKGLASSLARTPLGGAARQAHLASRKLQGLGRLARHYQELRRRRVVLSTAFMGPATNKVIPSTPLMRALYPELAGRNASRMGVVDMQSVHFPDGTGLGIDADGHTRLDTFVMVTTPPDAQGELSHGPANGVNSDLLAYCLKGFPFNLLLYLNPRYPFTRGWGDAPNTFHVDELRPLAEAGKLLVVNDTGKIPSLPAHSFDDPSSEEAAIAQNVVNHIEMHPEWTRGRALQVGFGGMGALAIKGLRESSWTGRGYSEMLEPFTLDLFNSGKIAGSHFIERDGRRTQLDGKIVATFSICEEGSDFYQRLDRDPRIVLAAASRVVVPEAFYYGLGVNSCLGVDFHGHVNSGGRDKNHYSGIGGAAVIMRGLARGGVGYLCLKSTHRTPEGKVRSSIFPFMPRGTPISHVGPDLMGGREGARFFLVTEHGVAPISARSQGEFIRSIISVADPRFRDWLWREAWREFRVQP